VLPSGLNSGQKAPKRLGKKEYGRKNSWPYFDQFLSCRKEAEENFLKKFLILL
jgi:hypothetical protein